MSSLEVLGQSARGASPVCRPRRRATLLTGSLIALIDGFLHIYDADVSRERLDLALSRIPPSAWENFEHFASEFLIADFPDLRTMARQSGDAGRDAEVVDLHTEVVELDKAGKIKLQYSVTAAWRSKITKTVDRLVEQSTKPTHLVYATNQMIGPEADDLKAKIFKDHGIMELSSTYVTVHIFSIGVTTRFLRAAQANCLSKSLSIRY